MSDYCHNCSNFTDDSDLKHVCNTCLEIMYDKLRGIQALDELIERAEQQIDRCLKLYDMMEKEMEKYANNCE